MALRSNFMSSLWIVICDKEIDFTFDVFGKRNWFYCYYVLQYYYEPETGNKFRSLRSIERYINGEEYAPQSRSRTLLRNNFEASLIASFML